MRRQGLLTPHRRYGGWLAGLAAVLAAVVILVPRWQKPIPPPPANYVLLLYSSPGFEGGNHEEYARWARQNAPLIAGGEELASGVLEIKGSVTPLPQPQPALAGYFLIAASSDAEARGIARECPHLRHGGAVVLRRIAL